MKIITRLLIVFLAVFAFGFFADSVSANKVYYRYSVDNANSDVGQQQKVTAHFYSNVEMTHPITNQEGIISHSSKPGFDCAPTKTNTGNDGTLQTTCTTTESGDILVYAKLPSMPSNVTQLLVFGPRPEPNGTCTVAPKAPVITRLHDRGENQKTLRLDWSQPNPENVKRYFIKYGPTPDNLGQMKDIEAKYANDEPNDRYNAHGWVNINNTETYHAVVVSENDCGQSPASNIVSSSPFDKSGVGLPVHNLAGSTEGSTTAVPSSGVVTIAQPATPLPTPTPVPSPTASPEIILQTSSERYQQAPEPWMYEVETVTQSQTERLVKTMLGLIMNALTFLVFTSA